MLSGKSRRRRLKHLYYFSRSWSWVSNTHVTDVACKVRVKPARAAVEREENCCCCHNYGFETGLFMWFLLTEIKKQANKHNILLSFISKTHCWQKSHRGTIFSGDSDPNCFHLPSGSFTTDITRPLTVTGRLTWATEHLGVWVWVCLCVSVAPSHALRHPVSESVR